MAKMTMQVSGKLGYGRNAEEVKEEDKVIQKMENTVMQFTQGNAAKDQQIKCFIQQCQAQS